MPQRAKSLGLNVEDFQNIKFLIELGYGRNDSEAVRNAIEMVVKSHGQRLTPLKHIIRPNALGAIMRFLWWLQLNPQGYKRLTGQEWPKKPDLQLIFNRIQIILSDEG